MKYFYDVECSWCGDYMGFRECEDASMSGKLSHGCCPQCYKVCEERTKEYKQQCDNEDISAEAQVSLYAASLQIEVEDHEAQE